MSQKCFLAAAAASFLAGAGLLLRSQYERNRFVTEEYTFRSKKITGGPARFVFLTDLHDKTFGPGNKDLKEAILKEKPDAVLVGGDMMVAKGGRCDLAVTRELMGALARKVPVYYAEGNHEARLRDDARFGDAYRELRSFLSDAGVHYLEDESVDFREDIRLTGCGIGWEYYKAHFLVPRMPSGEIEKRVGKADREKYNLLLFHSPLFLDAASRWGADLVLSGHFHGGTVRLPGIGGLMTPQYQFFLPACAGLFREGNCHMLVGRGLGTHSVNIRINDLPQIAVVNLLGD